MYSFNINTQAPVLAVSNRQTSPASVPIAGTIIPVRRQAPLVQLTPISSCPSVQPVQTNSFTPNAPHNLPVLLPKQPQNVSLPTVQIMGTTPAPRLTSIPVMANLPNQPQHAGTLILPGGHSLSVQSVKTDNYLTPNSSGKLQLVPMLPNSSQVQYVAPNVDKDVVNVPGAMNTLGMQMHYPTTCDNHGQSHSKMENNSTSVVHKSQVYGSTEDQNFKEVVDISKNRSSCLEVRKKSIEGRVNLNEMSGKVRFRTSKRTSETANDVGNEDIKALRSLVDIVKGNEEQVAERQHDSVISHKENNVLTEAFDIVDDVNNTEAVNFEIAEHEQLNKMQLTMNDSSSPPTLVLEIEQTPPRGNAVDGIYCVTCNSMLEGPCKTHTEPRVHVFDSPILSYARASVPRILELKPSLLNRTDTGVFSRVAITKNTQFGPMIGESYTNEEFERSSCALSQFWLIFNNDGQCLHMIHNASEEHANWMKFVRQARSSQHQNLVAYQQGGDIYFVANKDVEPNTELSYWYSKDTANFMGLHETPEDSFKCKQCQKQFTGDKLLKQHMKFKHPDTSARKFICKVCSKAFLSSSKLNTHMRGHAGIKPHKCNICSKTFVDRSNLKMHMTIHTGERKFVCTMCDKTFRQKAHLESHILTHTRAKTARCKFCQKAFARQSDLRRHESLHTKETVYKCELCSKEFYSKQNLKKHQKIHTGKKNFACERCHKSFYTNYHLKRHLSTCNVKLATHDTCENG